jgi:hypothetical protein
LLRKARADGLLLGETCALVAQAPPEQPVLSAIIANSHDDLGCLYLHWPHQRLATTATGHPAARIGPG